MNQEPIETKPPIGDADGPANAGGLSSIGKMIFLNMVQGWVANRKIPKFLKLLVFIALFIGNIHYNTSSFLDNRQLTLYDHFNISRLATFDQIKSAKDLYLLRLIDLSNPDFEGDKDLLLNYTMTKEQVADAFNILTHHILKEQYDKHNLYYSEDDFIKKKHKNIPNIEKYVQTVKGCSNFAPYFMIIQFSLGSDHQLIGRKMAIVGLLVSIFVCFELKKPQDGDNQMVELFNEYHTHEYVVKVLGPEIKHYTIYQIVKYLKEVIWQSFFQFSIAISRLVDVDPSGEIDKGINKVTGKQMKALHILEMMNPRRSEETRKGELSAELKKIREEREQKIAASEPEETKAMEEKKGEEKGEELKEEEPKEEEKKEEPKEEEKKEEPKEEEKKEELKEEEKKEEPKDDEKKEEGQTEPQTPIYTPEEKEELQQITLYLKSLTPEQITKKEAELLQRELAVEKREKALLAKESSDPFGKNIPDSEKTIEQLIMQEKQVIMDRLGSKRPKPPAIVYMKELKNTSWRLVIQGAWKYALDLRKQGMVEMSKQVWEKEKIKEKKQYRAISWLTKGGKCMGYLALATFLFTIIAPAVAMNYIQTQIKTGEWGADFVPKNVTTTVEAPIEKKEKPKIDFEKWRNYFEEEEEHTEEHHSWFDWIEN